MAREFAASSSPSAYAFTRAKSFLDSKRVMLFFSDGLLRARADTNRSGTNFDVHANKTSERAIYSDGRARLRVIVPGRDAFVFCFDRESVRLSEKISGISFFGCRKRELCTDSRDEKAFRMRYLADSAANKDGIFCRSAQRQSTRDRSRC